ncbi:alcohol dehydrogenase family protein [Marinobacter sp. M216]|uniref:Alcohol dehydrogenase family protein n=1 Tax=Marinobacter albus TaxID=3030833 RepID=A0ABT7HCZ9_9GAMM|nr:MULTISPECIES: alcohol dehydrogenase family protein [unclassified Marinobacter]MDK9558238.1 alcohol dehydrogenase family protein [Marinobacter sp. M216]
MSDLRYLQTNDPNRFKLRGDEPTMKAVVTTGSGGYEKLDYRDVPIPVPGPGEVLLRVLAAGVNNTEINTRLGWYSSSVEGGTEQLSETDSASEIEDGGWNASTPFPFIQGTDCCGEVVAAGEGVAQPDVGTRVLVRSCMRTNGFDSLDNLWMASDFDGAFAQYVKVPASEVFEIQCDWSDVELATIPCAYGTAENMLHRANVKAGDRVLVTGASGGVGSAVVQLAKRRGACIVAIAGSSKLDQVAGLGADQVIPRGSDLSAELQESSVDVVIDNVAGDQFGALLKLMARGGRYASSGAIAGPITTIDMRDFYLKDLTLLGCTAWDEPVFPNLISYIEKGEIRPLVAQSFELKDIATAQQEFLKKTHVGNFVLVPPQ